MESERKIEKLLRAYAKKRRAKAGEPLSLHPATRRLLQGEVARQKPEPDDDEESSVSLWQLFRQQWTLLIGFTLIIFLGATLFLPALSKAKNKAQKAVAMSNLKQIGIGVEMAAKENNGILPATLDELTNGLVTTNTLIDPMNGKPFVYVAAGKPVEELKSNEMLAYSEADKNGHVVLFADGEVKVAKGGEFRLLTNQIEELALAKTERRMESPAVAAAPPGAMPEPAADGVAMAASGRVATNSIGGGAPPVATTAPTMGIAAANQPASTSLYAGGLANNTRVTSGPSQYFAQKDLGAAQNFFRNQSVKNKSPVLTSFALQQNGNALRIVDRDGSVYDGRISNAVNGSDNRQLAQNYRFNVAGTNRTLQQNVVFNGSIEVDSNAPALAQQQANTITANKAANNQAQNAAANQSQQASWSNSRIAGTAIVNATNKIEVDALPLTP